MWCVEVVVVIKPLGSLVIYESDTAPNRKVGSSSSQCWLPVGRLCGTRYLCQVGVTVLTFMICFCCLLPTKANESYLKE